MDEETFASYRAANQDLGAEQLKVLDHLRSDHRMRPVWENLRDKSGYALVIIMSCFRRAVMVPQKSDMLEQLSKDFLALNDAETLLRKYFSPFLPVDGMNAPNHIVERGEEMLKVKAALDYVREFLREDESAHRYFISRFSPASRKTNDQVAAFTTMLCNEFFEAFGGHYYEQVTTIADVIYQLGESLSLDNMRMRNIRDARARAAGGLKPWSRPYNEHD